MVLNPDRLRVLVHQALENLVHEVRPRHKREEVHEAIERALHDIIIAQTLAEGLPPGPIPNDRGVWVMWTNPDTNKAELRLHDYAGRLHLRLDTDPADTAITWFEHREF